MKKYGNFIVKHRVATLIIGVLLLFPALIGFIKTNINYDILTYLPNGIDSVEGEHVLDKVFSDAATGFLVVKGMPDKDIAKMKTEIAGIDGVGGVIWKDNITDITIPSAILPDVLSSVFTQGDSTMMLVQFKNSASSSQTQKAIGEIRTKMNGQCFLSGISALVKDTVDLADKETPKYILLAVLLSLVVMCFALESWVVPFLFLGSIGMAILYNLGSNIIFGQISYITKALAAVLQIGVTMDFAIFLYNRYEHELKLTIDKEEAMANAIANSFTAVFGSGLATTCGFMALGIMKLTLGRDIGFVMAKGVFLSVISTMTILPSLLLVFHMPIHKYRHKTIMPSFKWLSKFVVDKRVILLICGIIILIPAYIGQKNVKVYYNLEASLPESMPSIVSLNVLKKDFDMATTHMVLVHDTVASYKIGQMADEISKLPGISKVLSADQLMGPGIPSSIIPDSVKNLIQKGGYKLMLVNSSYESASDQSKTQLGSMNAIVKKYDPKGMITGEGALTNDLIQISDTDFKNVSMISIAVIFAVILLMFTSVTLPVLLVCAIQLAIFINMGIPYYTGTTIPFIASIVIGCIQLAATVDYAILLSSSYREHIRNGENKLDAMKIAVQHSTRAIVTSAFTFFAATFGVYLISTISLLKSLTLLISRGAIVSTVVIIFVLPALLLLFETVLEKTSLFWKNTKRRLAAPANAEDID